MYLQYKQGVIHNYYGGPLDDKWEPTLLVHCLYKMSPLNHKRTTSRSHKTFFSLLTNNFSVLHMKLSYIIL